jgi:hypothetical protein
MRIGNITLNSRPDLEDHPGGICLSCYDECEAIATDESFDDSFGNVTDWSGPVSDCCQAEIGEDGKIFLDKSSVHTARRDHADGKIKTGDRYRKYIRKGWVIEDSQKRGIFVINKKVIKKNVS